MFITNSDCVGTTVWRAECHDIMEFCARVLAVMLAGYDEKKTLLWTMTANDSLYGRTVGAMNGQVRVPQGSFKSTTDIWMRIIVLTSGR